MRNALSLSFLLIVLSAALGCTQPVADSPPESVGESTSTLLLALPPATVFNAFVDGNCANVGAWSARRTFSYKAMSGFCTFVWNGSGAPSYDELRTALVARGARESEIFADFTCASGGCVRPTAAPSRYRPGGGAGSVACYRCIIAEMSMGVLYVSLPPAMVKSEPSPIIVRFGEVAEVIMQPGNAAAFAVPIEGVPPDLGSVLVELVGSGSRVGSGIW